MSAAFGAARRMRCPAEVTLLLWLYGAGLVVFAATRLAFVVLCHERLAGVPLSSLVGALALGALGDVAFLAWPLLPAWALMFLPRAHWAERPLVRALVGGWTGLCAFLLLVGVASDLAHFQEFDVRLNGTSLDYVRRPGHLLSVLYHEFALVPVLLGLVAFSWWSGRRAVGLLARRAEHARGGTPRTLTACTVLLALVALGSTGPAWAAARRTPDLALGGSASGGYLVEQLAANGAHNFVSACLAELADEDALRGRIERVPARRAMSSVRRRLTGTRHVAPPADGSPLWRAVDTGRPERRWNVVLVLMESFSARGIASLGGAFDDAPRFDALAADGVVFDNLLAVGTRTNRGLAGTLSSLPSLPGLSPVCCLEPGHRLFTLGDVLRGRGYRTVAVCGGDRQYDNLDAYLTSGGFERLVALDDFAHPTFSTEWGVCDDDVFARAIEEFRGAAAGGAPFLGFVLTLSNHRPYRVPPGAAPVPEDDPEAAQRAAFRYADAALGRFLDAAREEPWFDDTLFVLVADHGRHLRGGVAPDLPGCRIPLLLYAPGRVAPARVSRLASQLDVAPTVMGLLGGAYEGCFFGADLLAPDAPARAMVTVGDYVGWIEDELVVVWLPDGGFEYFRPGSAGALVPARPDARRAARARAALLTTARAAYDVTRGGLHAAPDLR